MGRFERHVFVCLNEREKGDPRGCCSAKGSEAVHARLKEMLKQRGLHRRIRANRAGCMDACAFGVTVVVYPDNVWYGGVTLSDLEEIVESHLIRGVPVARLVIPEEKLRTA
jgi:(2Fe-2S) ferredoxin